MKNVLFFGMLLPSVLTMAQAYEPDSCDGTGNVELKNWTEGKEVSSLYLFGCGPGWADNISTSFLKASGKPPAKPVAAGVEYEIDEEWEDYLIAYDEWTCKYGANNLMDGNPATAWVEGVKGYGVGEIVMIVDVDLKRAIQIWNGYGKSEALHKYNGRVKSANTYVVRSQYGGATQCGTVYSNFLPVASSRVELKDHNGFQTLIVPDFEKETYEFQGSQREYDYWLALEILDVYPGTKWEDTCISEVRNTP